MPVPALARYRDRSICKTAASPKTYYTKAVLIIACPFSRSVKHHLQDTISNALEGKLATRKAPWVTCTLSESSGVPRLGCCTPTRSSSTRKDTHVAASRWKLLQACETNKGTRKKQRALIGKKVTTRVRAYTDETTLETDSDHIENVTHGYRSV